jgi:hypothetical protein
MRIDNKGSTSTLPRGGYSTTPAQYTPSTISTTTTTPRTPTETVRIVAVSERVTLSYDAGEAATRRMIRKLNER